MFTVDQVVFQRASGGFATGVCTAVMEATRQQHVVYKADGMVWAMPYTEFFDAVLASNGGERPQFMPINDNGQPYRFSTGDRIWDPETDLGMGNQQ